MARNEPHHQNADLTAKLGSELSALIDATRSELSTDEREAIAALPSGSALLVVRRGPDAGARFLLDSDTTIAGRHPEVEIFLDDVTVSRKHAQFTRTGLSFSAMDLNSLNGTFCNGQRMAGAVQLNDGDEVQVGKFRLTFFASRRDLVTEEA